jgi:ABC-2 type transport system permease protein/lipopolysaccharide transport system permease protein
MNDTIVPEAPPAELRFRRRIRVGSSLRELWLSRELIRSLAERDLRARYNQAFLGFAWAILTPVALMVVFTIFFQGVAKIDTGGVPYALFAYVGLVPWTFFSTSVSQGGQSLLTNTNVLTKVYCPREVFPLASVMVAAVDAVIALTALLVLFAIYTFAPAATTVWVPLLVLIQLAFTLGFVLIISTVVIFLRDLKHVLPILLQLGIFATPVAYPMSKIPADVQVLYSIINPLAPIIDGYRRTVLYGLPPEWHLLGPATATSLILLVGGYLFFKRMEADFADAA